MSASFPKFTCFQFFLILHGLALDFISVGLGVSTVANQGANFPFLVSPPLDNVAVASLLTFTNGLFYALLFAFPRASWRGTFGYEIPDTAFIAWRTIAFCGFMIYLLPMTIPLSWQLYAWLLFLGPMVHFLVYITICFVAFHYHPLFVGACVLLPYLVAGPILLGPAP